MKAPSFKSSYMQIMQNGFDASLIIWWTFLFGLNALWNVYSSNKGPWPMLSIVLNNWITHANSQKKEIYLSVRKSIQMASVFFSLGVADDCYSWAWEKPTEALACKWSAQKSSTAYRVKHPGWMRSELIWWGFSVSELAIDFLND